MFFADSKVREETTNNKNASPCTRNGAPASKIMEDRDMDGYPLDKSLCLKPDERVWSSNSILQYDELFTRYNDERGRETERKRERERVIKREREK